MGGKRKFVERLDRFFTLTEQSGRKNDNASGFIGQYVHGNEPSHHVAYLYGYAGEPRKTQYYVHKICTELYNISSSGYAGNDDCGEMSAWLVFSAMGFYPVNPASGEYALGTPMMDKVTVHLAGGRTFTVNAHRKDSMSFYVKSVRLDGRKYDRNTISHKAITDGGTLDFYLE